MNERYFILGASSDMGMAFLERLCLNGGISVIAHARAGGRQFEELISQMNGIAGVSVKVKKADLLFEDETMDLMSFVKREFSFPTHIAHFPADSFNYSKMSKLKWEKVQKGLDIQVRSLFFAFKEFLPLMAKQGSGKAAVVLSSSIIGLPPKHMADYVIAKHALLGLVNSAASEWAGKVAVNAVSPGMVKTKFWAGVDERLLEMGRGKENSMNEVMDALEFLLSEKSDGMNGVNLEL
ncbi:MAG: SDR family oxidoreductase [Clostridiales bacterium]|jgi:NAD(P)-dependent dehydrogenase (short-subunit alcohol dehydrogenase family)|nr:SDR family oxidoreductase [Clostridiales bacterium]